MSRNRQRQHPSHEHEASRLRNLARKPDVLLAFRPHAKKEMQKDGIVKLDIANMLKRCSVSKVEDCGDEISWRAEGTDNDGRKIAAEVVIYEDTIVIKIVTAWAAK